MQDQKLEANRDELQAERARLANLLNFCADPDTRASYTRRIAEIRTDLEQFDAVVRLAQPRTSALRERNLRRLGISAAGIR